MSIVFRNPTKAWTEKGVPKTKYDRARAEWDERIGSARVQARNWRLMALGLLGVAALLAGGLIYQSTKSRVTPYVVRVNTATGVVDGVGLARAAHYAPKKAEIDYFLSQFIQDTRSLPMDPVVAKRHWLTAYRYLAPAAAHQMNAYVNANNPLSKIGQESVNVRIRSVVPVSAHSYQIQWTQTRYSQDGTVLHHFKYTGIFTVAMKPPRTIQGVLTNPLGIYITSFSWSRDV